MTIVRSHLVVGIALGLLAALGLSWWLGARGSARGAALASASASAPARLESTSEAGPGVPTAVAPAARAGGMERVSVSAASQSGPAATLLVVEVVRADDDSPIENARVILRRPRAAEASTGADGRVSFVVGLQRPPLFEVFGSRAGEGQTGRVGVEALVEGETRVERVRLRVGPTDLGYFGRVVRALDDAPLAGVEVLLLENGFERIETTSDAEGLFFLQGRSWAGAYAELSFEGHGLVQLPLEEGHERPEDAQLVRMYAQGALEGRVLQGGGLPAAGAEVVLEAPSFTLRPSGVRAWVPMRDLRWRARTDEQGRFVLGPLPARAFLEIDIRWQGERREVRPEVVALDPGQILKLDWLLAEEGHVDGMVRTRAGVPVVGAVVVRHALDPGHGERLSAYPADTEEARRCRSARDGSFRLVDVPMGAWLVGIEGDERGRIVRLGSERREVEGVELVVERPLPIAGRVVDSAGEALDGIDVVCLAGEGEWVGSTQTTAADGQFRFDSRAPGTWSLMARDDSPEPVFQDSELLEVQAGQEQLELVMQRGAVLEGWLVEAASGAPLEGVVFLHRDGQTAGDVDAGPGGHFRASGLLPGRWHALAWSHGLEGLSAAVELGPGVVADGVVVEMHPGARLSVQVLGAFRKLSFRVEGHGLTLFESSIDAGTRPQGPFAILPGPARILLYDRDDLEIARRELELVGGEEQLVVFELEPPASAASER